MTDEDFYIYIAIIAVPFLFGYIIPSLIEKIFLSKTTTIKDDGKYSKIQEDIDTHFGINDKRFRKRCKHKNVKWYVYNDNSTMFCDITGEIRYLICEDCKKVVTDMFAEYEGCGYK